jgi:Xaa-Pro aminopeptidase
VSIVSETYGRRIERVRERMEGLEIDALLLSHGGDLPWLTGYRAMPLERLTLLIISVESDEATLIVPALEAPRVTRHDDQFTVLSWDDSENPLSIALRILPPTGRRNVAISDRAWAETLLDFQRELPDTHFAPVSLVTAPLRSVKDDLEVECLRSAAHAADRVAHEIRTGVIPLVGRTEADVARSIAESLIVEGHQRATFTIVGSGPNSASPHHQSSERVIRPDEVVVCDFGGEFNLPGEGFGYCSDITRTFYTGKPTMEVSDCYEVLYEAQNTGCEAARAGARAEDVDAVTRSVIADAGYGEYFIHRTGHGIGIDEHEEPYIVKGNSTLLAAGNAFSIEPGIYLPGRFGMRIEDIVVATPDGPERLNAADHSLGIVSA